MSRKTQNYETPTNTTQLRGIFDSTPEITQVSCYDKCPCCGSPLLMVSELVQRTVGQEWIIKQVCPLRKTTGCP
jgi:hypothetical protein